MDHNPLLSKTYLLRAPQDLTSAVMAMQHLPLLRESSSIDRALLATMASELGSNILKFAREGLLKICRKESRQVIDIELWAEDKGPGIGDIELALQDHFSTGGTLGLGLPGVKRMADEFRIRSEPGSGTVVYVRKRIQGPRTNPLMTFTHRSDPGNHPDSSTRNTHRYDVGSNVRPCLGEAVSGDAAIIKETEAGLLLGMVDATGHGAVAHQNAERVVRLVHEHPDDNLVSLIQAIHDELQGTRGAALGLLHIDSATQCFRYLGVGNIRAAKIGEEPWRGLSRDGVLGSRLPHPYEQQGTLASGNLLLLWTDGLPQLKCQRLAQSIFFKSAPSIAKTLISKLGKLHDDAGCLVLKWPP